MFHRLFLRDHFVPDLRLAEHSQQLQKSTDRWTRQGYSRHNATHKYDVTADLPNLGA